METVEIFLRAEQTEQESMSDEQIRLVRQLLTKYAVIEITEGGRLLYRGAVCGSPDSADSGGLCCRISALGNLQPGAAEI